jgi:hypothetical protein
MTITDLHELDEQLNATDAGDAERRVCERLGVTVPNVEALASEILGDMRRNPGGVAWWSPALDRRRRVLVGDHLYQCIVSIGTNLLEMKLHLMAAREVVRQDEDYVNRTCGTAGELPRPQTLHDALVGDLWNVQVAGYARAGVAGLDCIGAAIIGVVGLEQDLHRATLAHALRALNGLRRPGGDAHAKLRLGFRGRFRRMLKSGPRGWRHWLEQTRHALAHRARRIMPTHVQMGEYTMHDGRTNRRIRRLRVTHHLLAEPWKSEVELFRSGKFRPALHEDARVTLQGVLDALREFAEAVCADLLAVWRRRRARPNVFPQPARQWRARSAYPPRFRGVTVPEPAPPGAEEFHLAPTVVTRLAAARVGKLIR